MKNTKGYTTNHLIEEYTFADKLSFQSCPSEIDELIDCSVNMVIVDYKFTKACTCDKLIIKGYKVLKIRYSLKKCGGKIICETFKVPFFEMIPLPLCSTMVKAYTKITYSDIHYCQDSSFFFYNVVTVCLSICTPCYKPHIYNENSNNICPDWHFKNDSYPCTNHSHCSKNVHVQNKKEECDSYIDNHCQPINKECTYHENPCYYAKKECEPHEESCFSIKKKCECPENTSIHVKKECECPENNCFNMKNNCDSHSKKRCVPKDICSSEDELSKIIESFCNKNSNK